MTDLGTLGGDTSYAFGINDSGEVVGYSYLADNVTRHAFIWTVTGGMVDLGTLPGGAWSQGEKINASGEISGEGGRRQRRQVPFFWSPSTGFVTAPGPFEDGSGAYGFGINDAGVVTGQAYLRHDILYGILWSAAGKIRFIPGLIYNFVVGYDINNRNHIAGTRAYFQLFSGMRLFGYRDRERSILGKFPAHRPLWLTGSMMRIR